MYKVLIVEDENMIRKGLRYTFDWSTQDCVVIGEAENGHDGVEQIRKLCPDIVLTDLNMPTMSGLEMMETVKNECVFAPIVITAHEDFAFAQKAIQLGVVEYLIKPVNNKKLHEALKRAKKNFDGKRKLLAYDNKTKSLQDTNLILDKSKYSGVSSATVRFMIEYVRQNFKHKIYIDNLADHLGYSSTTLNTRFKQETSHSFNDFVNRYRIKKAVQMIQLDTLKIYSIASEVGFKDYRYFITVFKKYTNSLPSDFLPSDGQDKKEI